MDYQHIEDAAGSVTAQIIRDEYESLNYAPIDPELLDDLTRGAVILGAETIDAPYPDGIILYIKQPSGAVIALEIDSDTDDQGYIELIKASCAMIKEGIT